MKFQVDKDAPPESRMTSKWKNVSDTNLGHINPREFKKRMFGLHNLVPTTTTRKMMKSGIVHAVGFLPTTQCTELVAECARHYNLASRDIVAPNGRILANISDEAIREAFRILEYHNAVYVTKDEADRMYQDHLEEYDAIVNHSWLDKPRKGASKLQRKSLVRAYFKEDIVDMIVLLNRIMGNPQGASFEPWMYYLINEIMNGVKMIDWARMISDNLDS